MKDTINLNKPITINGQLVTELTYDTEEITAALFCEADTRRRIDAGVKNVAIIPSAEFDFGLHPYLGMAAVIAVNPDYDFADMGRISGPDLLELMAVGRNFILRSEGSEQKPSDEQSEITAEPTTAASPILKKDE